MQRNLKNSLSLTKVLMQGCSYSCCTAGTHEIMQVLYAVLLWMYALVHVLYAVLQLMYALLQVSPLPRRLQRRELDLGDVSPADTQRFLLSLKQVFTIILHWTSKTRLIIIAKLQIIPNEKPLIGQSWRHYICVLVCLWFVCRFSTHGWHYCYSGLWRRSSHSTFL